MARFKVRGFPQKAKNGVYSRRKKSQIGFASDEVTLRIKRQLSSVDDADVGPARFRSQLDTTIKLGVPGSTDSRNQRGELIEKARRRREL